MRLEAGCELQVKAAPSAPFLALLRPQSGAGQKLLKESLTLTPSSAVREFIDTFGNRCVRSSAPSADFTIRSEVTADVPDEILVNREARPVLLGELPDAALQYLLPSRYCPSDKMLDQARTIAKKADLGYPQVEAFVRYIREHIKYKYGASDASTDALDTLKAKKGVCRDYAHVGISLCRALKIPARMVAGYLVDLNPMDLHAWFEAFLDGNWYTFDATQDGPRGGRIVIAYGRDAADVALITELGEFKTKDMKVWVNKLEA